MTTSPEMLPRMNALTPAMSEIDHGDREIRRLRMLLLFLMLVEAVAVSVPRVSNLWRDEFGFLPQILIGFVALALSFTLHLAWQHKLMREIGTALVAATSYVDRLEQISLIDTPTQLFNRRYLDELFTHQLKWLTRGGRSVTLLLLELILDGQEAAAEEIVIEAAFILRSNFRSSDYVVRYFTDQFLVVLPDTNEQQAQIALSRLIDKVRHWNFANVERKMELRLGISVCSPGANLWEKLSEMEEKVRDQSHPEVRSLITQKPAAYESDDLRPESNVLQ